MTAEKHVKDFKINWNQGNGNDYFQIDVELEDGSIMRVSGNGDFHMDLIPKKEYPDGLKTDAYWRDNK